MTEQLRKEIENELNKIYHNFDEWTDEYIEEKVAQVLHELIGEKKQRIELNGNTVFVCPITVALETGDENLVTRDDEKYYMHHSRALQLLVDESGIALVVKSYDCYEPESENSANIYENESYEVVELNNVVGRFTCI